MQARCTASELEGEHRISRAGRLDQVEADRRWETAELLSWHDHFMCTSGRRQARAEAAKLGLAADADDIQQDWHIRVRRSFLARGGAAGSLDIYDEAAARAYSRVVLRHTVIDHWRRARRCERLPLDVPTAFDCSEDVLLRATLEAVKRRLQEMQRVLDSVGVTPSTSSTSTTIGVALAVVEVGTGAAVGPHADLRGGTSEWDRLIHQALLVWSARSGQECCGRCNDASRQFRSRCGRRVRRLLAQLLEEEGIELSAVTA